MSNTSDAQSKLAGELVDYGGEATMWDLCGSSPQVSVAVDGNAADNTALYKVWTNPYPFPMRINAAKINPSAALTANATNYATIAIATDDGIGGAPATALSILTNATSWTANNSVSLSVSNYALLSVPVGGNIWRSQLKSGAGVVVPVHVLGISLHKR